MATYYVDGVNGDDSNSGTSKDQAWKTIDKAASTLTAGDKVYIAPATYREEATCQNSGNATDGYIEYIGDYKGEIFGRKGYPRITGLASDADTTPTYYRGFHLNGQTYIKIRNFQFDSQVYRGIAVEGYSSETDAYVEIENCRFISSPMLTSSAAESLLYINNGRHVDIKRCFFVVNQLGIAVVFSDNSSDKHINIKNCIFIGTGEKNDTGATGGSSVFSSYANVNVYHCAFIGGHVGISVFYTNSSYKHVVKYNIFQSLYYGIRSNASDKVTEDYNYFAYCNDAKYNVTDGANSKEDVQPLFFPWSLELHPDSSLIDSATGSTETEDYFGNPRPLKGGVDIGPIEYNPPEQQESTEKRTGSYSLKLTSASFKDIRTFVSLPAGSYTVSVYVKWSGYSGSDKPQLIVKQDKYCGINSDQIATATGDGTSWEQLSVNITLTEDAEITIRLYARDTGSSAVTYFDDLDISSD